MIGQKKPMVTANRLSSLLSTAWGRERFPVKVNELALEYSRQSFPDSPIDRVQGEDLSGFDGMLTANKARSKWLILYNHATASEGRKRFTIAHELGHYLLHRQRQDRFECGNHSLNASDHNLPAIETEADGFASTLLMPRDDFRDQVDGQPISFDLLGHCADRYGVSLTAATLRWLEIVPQRAVLVVSRDDHMLWAKSNAMALQCGAYFATRKHTIELPQNALAHSRNATHRVDRRRGQAHAWFARAPASLPITEMTHRSDQSDIALTLLLLPEADELGFCHDEVIYE